MASSSSFSRQLPADSLAQSSPNDIDQLLDVLATLRMLLPSLLLGILVIRFVVKSFLALMARVQAQGWNEEEGEAMFNATIAPPPTNGEEDEIHPVVVKISKQRRGLILSLFAIVAMTYFFEGASQVIATLIRNMFTPDLAIFKNIIYYVVGGLSSFALCSVQMNAEERSNKKEGAWGKLYPRMITSLGIALDISILAIIVRIIQLDTSNQPSQTVLPIIDLGFISIRILLLFFLLLSQTPLLYKSNYVPHGSSSSDGESTSLLGSNDTSYGAVERDNSTSIKKKSVLRSSRPPTNRPPDANSLSLLTLFTRIKVLFPYLWPSKSLGLQILAVICFGLMLLKRFVNVLTPLFFGRIIGDLSAARAPYINIGLYVGASFLQDSNTMLYRYLWLPVSQYSEREMSNLSYECLLNLSLSFHTKRKTGELLRILSRADAINDFFETLIFTFIPILIDLPVAAIILYTFYGTEIVAVVMAVSVIFVATSVTLAESRTKLYRALRDQNVFMSQIKTDSLLNWETVKIFTAERFEAERLRTAMRVYQKGYFNVYSSWNSLSLIQDAISAVGLLVCSFILARRVINHEIDIGLYVTFISYLSQIYSPLNKIAGLYKTVMSNLVDTEQLMDLLNSEKDVVDSPGAKDLVIEHGSGSGIVFDNVKFSYDGKRDTIKGISFEIPFGKTCALVGDSGAGKSSIMRLLYRFYDVTEGSISIGGTDIRKLTQSSLRQQIGLVPQDSVLFNETVRYNIGYGNHEASEEEIAEAAKSAAIHDRILSFPDQYETRVGERGQKCSGGERQRIAIARVLLKDAPILLLDEATSALDTANERQIQQRLREISKGRTTLAIAHRLSTIVDSDIIYVLSEGLIAEFGSHAELLEKNGLYAVLWQKQIQADSEAAGLVVVDAKKSE